MSPINPTAYISDAAYDALLDRIEDALINPSMCTRTALIEALGAANVWPVRCLEDRLSERQRRRERGLKD